MKAFISYCHADRDLMTKFRGHLTPLERKFGLTVFSDQEILPGAQWEKWIWDEFERSEIVFVLVSVEFIKSNFCFNREFRKAITRHKKKEAVVVPVILSPCAWQNVRELSQLKALPDDGEPIRGGRFRVLDKGFLNAMNGINKLLTALSLRRG